jgi:hypothetical protein
MAGYNKILPGMPLEMPARIYNALVDLAIGQDFSGRGAPSKLIGQSGIFPVQNTSGFNVDRFGVLGLSEPLILPASNLPHFQERIGFKGVTPANPAHLGKFAILLDPIPDSAIGRGVIAGAAIVQLSVPTGVLGKFADVNDGDTTKILNGDSGTAFVLWAEDNAQSTQWAIVRIGGGGSSNGLVCLGPILVDIDQDNCMPIYKYLRVPIGSTLTDTPCE